MPDSAKEWFIGRDGKRQGPYSAQQIRRAVVSDNLRPQDLVWTQGFKEWTVAAEVPELAYLWPPAAVPEAAAAEPEIAAPVAEPPSSSSVAGNKGVQTSRGYLSKHWHGDFSLAHAYWVNNFAVNILLTATMLGLSASGFSKEFGIRSTGLWILGLLVVCAVVGVWSVVGVWNSAQAHKSRGGSQGWAVLAMLLVVSGTLRLVQTGITEAPLAAQSFDWILGRDSQPPAELRVLNRATEVEIAGGLSFGTADRLKTILDATPTIHLVQLNNRGGWIQEGERLGALVAERKLSTYSARECDSACLLIFLSGEERFLGAHARLGFHQASVAGVGGEVAQAGTNIIRASLERRRAPQAFIDHVLATDPSSIWYPTREELLAAHIITAVVDEHAFGETGIVAWHNHAKLEAEFDAIPLFHALGAAEPALYAKLKEQYLANVEAGVPHNETLSQLHKVMADEVVPKYTTHGENNALVGYWATQIAEMRELNAIDPKDCIAFLYPNGNETQRLNSLISAKAIQDDYKGLAALISATAESPADVPPKGAVEAALEQAARHAEKVHPGSLALIAKAPATGQHPDELCLATLAFYESILELRPTQAGPILRYMMAGN